MSVKAGQEIELLFKMHIKHFFYIFNILIYLFIYLFIFKETMYINNNLSKCKCTQICQKHHFHQHLLLNEFIRKEQSIYC